MNAFAEMLRSIGGGRLAAIAGVVLVVLGLFVFAMMQFSGNSDTALLYGDLSIEDSASVVSRLDELGIPYELKGDGSKVFVPRDEVLRLRLLMTEEGLIGADGVGYEIFDENDKIVTSQFVQNINHIRALEGELARTIAGFAQVKSARVHLVLPERQLFQRDKQEPSASIIVKVTRAGLDQSQIMAIQQLVSTAVPGLKPNKISIADDRGNLLARGAEEADGSRMASNAEEMRTRYQNRLVRQIEGFIGNIVGMGKVRAEVSVELDLDRVREDSEIYDPDGQVVRSVQTVEENSNNRNQQREPVTVANNLPENQADIDEQAEQGPEFYDRVQNTGNTSRVEEITNYEISKTIRSHVRETGVVRRLSVALLVDGYYPEDENGDQQYKPRDEEEIQKIEALVKSAVGFDDARGDIVQVINMQFHQPEIAVEEENMLGIDQQELMEIFQVLVIAVVGVLFLILIIRPLMRRIIDTIPTAATQAELLTSQLAQIDDRAARQLEDRTGGLLMAEEDPDDMVDISSIKGKVRMSTIQRIGDIIEQQGNESVSVLRNWIYQDID